MSLLSWWLLRSVISPQLRCGIILLVMFNVGGGLFLEQGLVRTSNAAQSSALLAPQATTLFEWQTKASAPFSRFESNGVAVGDHLYVFGGFDGNVDAFNQTQVYSPTANTWQLKAPMPDAITHAGIAVDGTTVWFVGGYFGNDPGPSTNKVWKYNTVLDSWSAGPNLPAPRGSGGAAFVGRKLYFFGGAVRTPNNHDDTDFPEHWVLDLNAANPTWTAVAPLPNPRNHTVGVALGGYVYAIGGQHDTLEGSGNQVDVHRYNPATNQWIAVAPLPLAKGHTSSSSFVVNGRIMVIGGSVNNNNGGMSSPDVLLYDPTRNVWLKFASGLAQGRKTPVAGVIGDKLVVTTGGGVNGGPTSTTWVALLPNTWETAAAMPVGAGEVATGIINNFMYVVGEQMTATLRYNLATNIWSPLPTLAARPFQGNHHTAEVINDEWYVFGGLFSSGNGVGNKVQIYNPISDTWRLGADIPFAAGSSSSALVGGKVYLAGGIINTSTTSRMVRYDPLDNTWTEMAAMPQGRNHAAAATDGTKLYIFGGRGPGSGNGNSVANGFDTLQIYDPTTNTWRSSLDAGSTLAPLPQARGGTGRAVYYEGEFYIFGGETTDGAGATANKVYERVDIYNPTTNTWRRGAPMPTARHGIFPVEAGGRIYVAGGGTVAGYSKSTKLEVYNPGLAGEPAPPFVEEAGLVVMEAEHYHNQNSTSKAWLANTERAGYTATAAMMASPNTGSLIDSTYATDSPEMSYEVQFTTLGTYYVWVRGWADGDFDNSYHAGIDGQAITSAAKLSLPTYNAWTWFNRNTTNSIGTITVSTPGVHTINVWMREDGLRLDRLLLSTDPNFIPSGTGPAESPQVPPVPVIPIPITPTATTIPPTATATAIAPTATSTAIPPTSTSTAVAPTVTTTATAIPPTTTSTVTATPATPTATPVTPTATAPVTATATVTTPTVTIPTAITPTVTGTVTAPTATTTTSTATAMIPPRPNVVYLPLVIR